MRVSADRLDLSRFQREGKLTEVELWRAKLPTGVKAPGAVASDGSLFVTTPQGISKVSPDGEVSLFASQKHLEVDASPVIDRQGRVYVSGTYQTDGLTAYGADGEKLWSKDFGSSMVPPAIGPDGGVYTSDNRGRIHKLDPATGEQQWSYDTAEHTLLDSRIYGLKVGEDGTVYAVGEKGQVSVIKEGAKVWGSDRFEHDRAARMRTNFCIADDGDTIYSAFDGHIWSKGDQSKENWHFSSKFETPIDRLPEEQQEEAAKGWYATAFGTTPVLSPDQQTIYVGRVPIFGQVGSIPSLVAIDREGDKKWEKQLSIGDLVGPENVKVTESGTIYVAGERFGNVQALSPDGELLWTFRSGNREGEGNISSWKDRVYLTTEDGTLHALHEEALKQRMDAIANGRADEDSLVIELGENEITIGDHGVVRR